jgi:hypothetical protein
MSGLGDLESRLTVSVALPIAVRNASWPSDVFAIVQVTSTLLSTAHPIALTPLGEFMYFDVFNGCNKCIQTRPWSRQAS